MKRRTLLAMALTLVMCFGLVMPAWASEIPITQKTENNPLDKDNMVLSDCSYNSYNDENGNTVQEEIKVYTGEDGWGVTETTQVITKANNSIVPCASGNVTKNKTVEIERFGEKVYRVYIWGKFQYDGSTATVVDASWNTRILSDSVHEEQAPYGESGTYFGTAHIWVFYNLGDSEGTWKGQVELRCDKNGN